jgi:hypothetical protein
MGATLKINRLKLDSQFDDLINEFSFLVPYIKILPENINTDYLFDIFKIGNQNDDLFQEINLNLISFL